MKQILLLLFLFPLALQAQNSNPLVMTPDISADGSTIAFSYQGDIWTIPETGGEAKRLTIHEAYESHPKFSADGNHIGFTGSRFGNGDIFVIPSKGGMPTRLTFHSTSDQISSWHKDDIIFSTRREFRQIERPSEVYSISKNGGTEKRILNAVGYDPIYSPSGNYMAYVRGDINPVTREDYAGPSHREIWVYDVKNQSHTLLNLFNTNDVYPHWVDDNTLLFMSSESGNYNLYSLTLNNGKQGANKPNKLTNFSENSIRYFSGTGNHIVFEQGSAIYKATYQNGTLSTPQKVSIMMSSDSRFDATENKSFSRVDDYAISPNGERFAFVARGEVFVSTSDKDISRSVNVTNSPARDMDPAWLNDSVLVFVSDRKNHNFDLYAVKSSDKEESDLFKSLKRETIQLTKTKEDESAPVISHDGKYLAYKRGRGELLLSSVDGSKLGKPKNALEGWATPYGVTFSPDNKWIAYSLTNLEFNTEIFIQPVDLKKEPVNISMHPRGDYSPNWSPDGRKLAFTSARNARNSDVWLVWLRQEDYERSKQDWKELEEPKKKDKSIEVKIDFKDIHRRLVQVTSKSGDEGSPIFSSDSETIYFTAENSGTRGRDLYKIKWDGSDLKQVTKGGFNPSSLSADSKAKNIYYTKRGVPNKLSTKSDKSTRFGINASMKIDYMAERAQVFDEAWRTIRDGFYDPDYHGYDWNALKDKYRPLALKASTNIDFATIFNFMLGELNASHMRFSSPQRAETQRVRTGLLGAELIPVKNGMRVERVVPGTPASKEESKLNKGEVITHVNGVEISKEQNFYALMENTINEKVLLHVSAGKKKKREVVIRPVSSIRQDLYQEWVDSRREKVEKWSNGQLGYIHIQGMNTPSFEVFERELTASGYQKEGLVIDVRYNGGGWTTDYLMTTLNYKQHAYTIPRGSAKNLEKEKKNFRSYYPIGERLVFAAWTKPSIALCNEGSYSNAEIFSHAYKTLGIGTLVGKATNGSVISTGGKRLVDGSFVRLPFRGWYTRATDQNQELGPAVPDIEVENSPDWTAKGTDKQLKTAVETLLKQIESK